jgi:hypothetical protein
MTDVLVTDVHVLASLIAILAVLHFISYIDMFVLKLKVARLEKKNNEEKKDTT